MPTLPPPEDWNVTTHDNGVVADGPHSFVFSTDKAATIFKRNALKLALGKDGKSGHVRVLVVKLDDVCIYIKQLEDGRTSVMVTKEDVYP